MTKTNLSVESLFIVCIPSDIMLHNYKIMCRSIQWCWIAPFTTKIIIGMMVDIVIWINYESSCLFPNIPWSIGDSSSICSFFVFMSAFRTRVVLSTLDDSIVSKLDKRLFCNVKSPSLSDQTEQYLCLLVK